MLTKIQKWGNSQGIRITKTLLADASINVGDDVNIEVKDGALIVTPAQKNRKNMTSRILWLKFRKAIRAKKPNGANPWAKRIGSFSYSGCVYILIKSVPGLFRHFFLEFFLQRVKKILLFFLPFLGKGFDLVFVGVF